MMSGKCKETNMNNNLVAKPLMKKIYQTHKKWLGGEKNSSNKKNEPAVTKSSVKSVILRKEVDHSHETVKLKRTIEKDATQIDCHKEEDTTNPVGNITVVPVPFERVNSENKLTIVINNFDKLLEEYKSPTKMHPTKIPKLQKAKTCSIIESKCILKKSVSQPFDVSKTENVQHYSFGSSLKHNRAKSLYNLSNIKNSDDKIDSRNSEKKENHKHWTVSTIYVESTSTHIPPKSVVGANTSLGIIKTQNKVSPRLSEENQSSKLSRNCDKHVNVKELVQRINSWNGSDSCGDKKDELCQQEAVKEEIYEGNQVIAKDSLPVFGERENVVQSDRTTNKGSTVGKQVAPSRNGDRKVESREIFEKTSLTEAVSNGDLSMTKKTFSRIPIKSNLRRSFPSTPSGLNNLSDHQIGRTDIVEENKSRLHNKFTRSVQNLNSSNYKLSLPMPVGRIERKVGKSMEDLNNIVLRIKNSKLSDSPKNVGTNMDNLNSAVVKVFSVAKKSSKSDIHCAKKSQTSTKIRSANSLNSLASSDTAVKGQPTACDVSSKLEKDGEVSMYLHKENAEEVENIVDATTHNIADVPYHRTKPDKVGKLKAASACKHKPYSNTQTFTKRQKKLDSKEVEVSSKGNNTSDVMSEAEFMTETPELKSVSLDMTKSCESDNADTIKLDLSTTQKFIKTIGLEECKNLYLDPKHFVHLKESEGLNIDGKHNRIIGTVTEPTKEFMQTSYDKLNYNSDEGSDDSGNISTEIEIDDQFSCSSTVRSRSSTDSLLSDYRLDRVSSQATPATQLLDPTSDATNDKIFFRNGVLSQLESQRDERLAGMVVNLQAHCRGYLARRRLSQRKLQDLAVRCIQRNVRKFLVVRDWPWWRLLVRVTPLLNVHRTEEELKIKTNELEALKIKLEKIENERTTLKHDKDKLEAKLSELTADLAEEHSTSTLATERLDAETSERIKLERELSEVQHKNKELQACSERLEMELLYARSDLNGIVEEDEDGEDGAVYKQRYERAVRELEFTKRRLQQQHEDDLEQLVALKKQLEKKLTDAYEEVEEQRQVVGQWKRKVQKLSGEMNDLRLLLEEQSARNNLLEKKQRKFDSETQMLQDELKKEKQMRDRLSREKELTIAEKYSLESTLADTRLELELKEEKLMALQREFDEITCGGKTEEEVTLLRKQKIDCERRLQDQEEELDELAGQVQLLEQAKLRLEMTLESMRKEAKKEAQMRDEELEEVRCNAQKKVKALEAQLENEHEERTLLLREKHELERRLAAAAESERNDRAGDEALLQRLKRDLKRTKALLRDTQAQLERQKAETPGKNMIRQLRNQLEDLECARSLAFKAKQTLEAELAETQASLEESHRQKNEAEERANVFLREKNDLQAQLEENEEELAEVLKKYKSTVHQMSLDQIALQEQVSLVLELEVERNQLKEQLSELTQKLESMESMGDASSNLLVKRNELKIKELESKLDLEHTTKSRLEVQITRLKEAVDKLQHEISQTRVKEQQAQDQIRKLQRHLREVKEELNKSLIKESEALQKKKDLEKRCENLETEASTARTDLRLALKRIEDLQSAIQGELDDTPSDNSDSEQDTYSSDESVNTFLANHTLTPKSDKSSSVDSRRLSNASRSSTSNSIANHSSYA